MYVTRPWTDSILGPLTPWDTKVGDVFCDTCGKKLISDITLGDLHNTAAWRIECARRVHFDGMKPPEMLKKSNKKAAYRFYKFVCNQKNDVTWHSQCTLKWTPIIEQKLKARGVF